MQQNNSVHTFLILRNLAKSLDPFVKDIIKVMSNPLVQISDVDCASASLK